jgi:hypothetical protein
MVITPPKPLLAAAVARKRQPMRGKAEIGLEIGAVLDKRKMAKHFTLDITDTRFSFARKTDEITMEAALDGLYVVHSSLPAAALDDTATVRSYKNLSANLGSLEILKARTRCG